MMVTRDLRDVGTCDFGQGFNFGQRPVALPDSEAGMISPLWCRTMAQYNLWQNRAILAAADPIGPVMRQESRGGLSGTLAGTLSHLLWTDRVWMARFDGGAVPDGTAETSKAQFGDWDIFRAERAQTDTRILDWASSLTDAALEGELFWMSKSAARGVSRPVAICVTHFYVQQAHHRGAVHAMLTAAGAVVDDTALFLMPDLLE